MTKLNKLCGRIREICGTQENCARQAGISTHSLSNKLNKKVPFKTDEIKKLCDILAINKEDVHLYFF